MVAPTRTPQARGVKCSLCKKILASATWLDQTKPAKDINEPQAVLSLVKQHNSSDCPCIPKNIENLLVGSTHFEIHRLVARKLDSNVEAKQYESVIQAAKQKAQSENPRSQNETILNDCYDSTKRGSRFKIYGGYNCISHVESSKQQLTHLRRTIDFWKIAMEDQTNPFNTKLALRLGLTHHVIYACYLFKYYKILDYQLMTANLLLNVFKSIEGVTANAVLHAYYLVIKSLIDCDQPLMARQYLRQAMKMNNYNNHANYESILIKCVACELSFIEGDRAGAQNILDGLSDSVYIKADDKLQHYYARTLAMSIIIRYIHQYPSKTDHCLEFFHTFRYVCAMIKRCYETSFELVLAEKDLSKKQGKEQPMQATGKHAQSLDHSWIRFAICDFVFNSFELLSEFFMRAGMPECLELIYNGLNLIPYRNGSYFWQSRILSIGARLDLLCDKHEDAKAKLDVLARLVSFADDPDLMTVIRLSSEVGLIEMLNQNESSTSNDVIHDVLNRLSACRFSITSRIQDYELFDFKSGSFLKLSGACGTTASTGKLLVIDGHLGKMSLVTLAVGINSALHVGDRTSAHELVMNLKRRIDTLEDRVLEFYDCQMIFEALLPFTGIGTSEHSLLDAIHLGSLFIEIDNDRLSDLQSVLSSLTLENCDNVKSKSKHNNATTDHRASHKRGSKIPTSRRSRRKGTYEVAIRSEETLRCEAVPRIHDLSEIIARFQEITNEEIVMSYLKNSEPNPHYDLYRRAHELMLTYRLIEDQQDHESILYHIAESIASNTMRYRWMMSEEQSTSPYDQQARRKSSSSTDFSNGQSSLKHLGFCSSLVNQGNVIKSITRTIPDDIRLLQLKYICDKRADTEHLLCVCITNNIDDQVYIHARRLLTSDDFYSDAQVLTQNGNNMNMLTIPQRLNAKIDESRKLLLMRCNHRAPRVDARQQIESDIGAILNDIENEWLGSFRFLLCGKICDPSYNSLVQSLTEDLLAHMSRINNSACCRSLPALRMVLENAPLLSRDEFCQLITTLFNLDLTAKQRGECFRKWQEKIELHMAEHNLGMNKTAYLKQLQRAQLGLILDNKLEGIPFESLPVARVLDQGIFRVPSLRLYSVMSTRRCWPVKVDSAEVAYMLDPASNLPKTRERFDNKLKSQKDWCGTIGQPPQTSELEAWLSRKQLYIFIGHGAGTAYYNKLCNGRGLSALPHVGCASIIMGCSSGRMLAEGPKLETFGIGWMFLFRGSPCYVGLLWDVTDNDIDRFLDDLLDKWLPSKRRWSSDVQGLEPKSITEVMARSRNVCQHKLLVGSTPVLYGMPIWHSDKG